MSMNSTEYTFEEPFPELDRVVLAQRGVDYETGLLQDSESESVNWTPIRVLEGDRLIFENGTATHAVYFYDAQADESLSSTYSYDTESNWTTYDVEASRTEWSDEPYIVPRDGFVRIVFNDPAYRGSMLSEHMSIERPIARRTVLMPAFANECERVIAQVESLREPDDCVLMVCTDIHHAIGDNWEDSARNMRICAEAIHPDAIVQLGDLTDGLTPSAVTLQLADDVLNELRTMGAPVFGCLGNHDANYFRGNAQALTAEECALLYLERESPDYFEDMPNSKLRLIFLNTFNPEREERYGFSDESVRWLRKALRSTPRGWSVLVFSHVPPRAKIHYWSDTIKNENRVLGMLNRFDWWRGGAVLGYIHGHNHADQILRDDRFPIISVGCVKYEYFQDKKPEGSVTPLRSHADQTQDLWEVLVVKPQSKRLEFVRFGAGESREIAR